MYLAGGGCFYGGDFVELVDGGKRSISKLNIGDRIWSISKDGKTKIIDEIILMMHNEPTKTSKSNLI